MSTFTIKRADSRGIATTPMHSVETSLVSLAAAIYVAVSSPSYHEAKAADPLPEIVYSHAPIQEVDIAPEKLGDADVLVDLSYMGNTRVGSLIGGYLGIKGTLPGEATINFSDSLGAMWDKKLRIRNVTPATQKSAAMILSRYASQERDVKSVKQFVEGIDGIAQEANSGIDYPALCKKLRVDDNKCAGFATVSGRIRGKNLAAYGMTELLPSHSGEFNYTLLDTLLRNAGENYLHSIPALGDKYMSLGFYQFTSFAVRHDSIVEGASVVSLYSETKIPGSVSKLVGNDHHVAAKYFATYNIGRLIRRLNNREMVTLLTKCSTDQLTEMVAVAHHNPKHALRNAERWIAQGCKKPLAGYLGPRLGEYARKTRNNLTVLHDKI